MGVSCRLTASHEVPGVMGSRSHSCVAYGPLWAGAQYSLLTGSGAKQSRRSASTTTLGPVRT